MLGNTLNDGKFLFLQSWHSYSYVGMFFLLSLVVGFHTKTPIQSWVYSNGSEVIVKR